MTLEDLLQGVGARKKDKKSQEPIFQTSLNPKSRRAYVDHLVDSIPRPPLESSLFSKESVYHIRSALAQILFFIGGVATSNSPFQYATYMEEGENFGWVESDIYHGTQGFVFAIKTSGLGRSHQHLPDDLQRLLRSLPHHYDREHDQLLVQFNAYTSDGQDSCPERLSIPAQQPLTIEHVVVPLPITSPREIPSETDLDHEISIAVLPETKPEPALLEPETIVPPSPIVPRKSSRKKPSPTAKTNARQTTNDSSLGIIFHEGTTSETIKTFKGYEPQRMYPRETHGPLSRTYILQVPSGVNPNDLLIKLSESPSVARAYLNNHNSSSLKKSPPLAKKSPSIAVATVKHGLPRDVPQEIISPQQVTDVPPHTEVPSVTPTLIIPELASPPKLDPANFRPLKTISVTQHWFKWHARSRLPYIATVFDAYTSLSLGSISPERQKEVIATLYYALSLGGAPGLQGKTTATADLYEGGLDFTLESDSIDFLPRIPGQRSLKHISNDHLLALAKPNRRTGSIDKLLAACLHRFTDDFQYDPSEAKLTFMMPYQNGI